MMNAKTFNAWVLAVSVTRTFHQSVDASYYCGSSYNDAIVSCDIKCPSALGYNPQSEVNECPDDKPYCFGPDLPCTPPVDDSLENRTTPANVGFLSLGDLSSGGNNTETHDPSATSVSSTFVNETNSEFSLMTPTYAGLNDTNITLAPENATLALLVGFDDTNATIDPSTARVTVVPTPAPTMDELTFRKSIDNPSNMFCGSGWQNATDECNMNTDAIPCPMMIDATGLSTPLDCPYGLMCFTIGMSCTPATLAPTDVPSLTPSSAAPTTYSPTSSPIAADDEVNLWFCGSDFQEANELCGQWCRSGEHTDCPQGQKCFKNTGCNATKLNFTISYDEGLISELPSIAPTTYKPTDDQNPSDYYCFDSWTDASYDGDCGLPCPGGQNSECPTGQFCYGPIPLCNPVYKVGVSDKWCGSTFEDMASKCSSECPGGSDEECGEGEKCWSDSPCALKQSALADLEALEGKLWCGKNYKDLVENCPMECPGGSDDECEGDMICFDMSTEEMSCNETGVGIKDPVDPLHLWCGATWNNVLEDCPKQCPEGTDEECGPGLICYDLTGNDLICRTAGIGVKAKGDPNKRWCGSDYNDMMSSCPRRCPTGSDDECPLGMSCYEDSECVTEGVGLVSKEDLNKDTSKMFCGTDYTEAMSCGTPCSSGSKDECPPGQTCWADVECLWGSENTQNVASNVEDLLEALLTGSTMAADVDNQIEDSADGETTQTSSSALSFSEVQMNQEGESSAHAMESSPTEPSRSDDEEFDYPNEQEFEPTASEEPLTITEVFMSEDKGDAEDFDYPTETESSDEWSMFTQVEMLEDEVANDLDSEKNEGALPQEQTQPEEQPQLKPELKPEPLPQTGFQIENIRMAFYGISQLSSDHINAWEKLTEEYFERFYNEFSNPVDATRSGVTDVDTIYEVTELSVSSARRGLRSMMALSDMDAYLLEYTQTTRYLSGTGVTLEEVLPYPFSNSRKRDAYVQFLKNSEPLFRDLSYVSAVFLPSKVEAVESSNSFSGKQSSSSSSFQSSGNPFGEPSSAFSSGQSSFPPPLNKFSEFYCHNSGEACPSGNCPDNDACIFVPSGERVVVGSYSPPGSDSSPDGDSDNPSSSIIEAFLNEASSGGSSPSSPNSHPISSLDLASSSTSDSSISGSGNIDGSSDSGFGSISAHSETTSVSITSSFSSNQPVELFDSNDAVHGPIVVKGEMTLTGMEMKEVDNIFEWQYLTSLYEQEFYNKGVPNGDYVKDSVNNVVTTFEIIEAHYGIDSNDPITVIKFKQSIKYDTKDEDIPVSVIVTQPFLTPEYRADYIMYLKQMLPASFGSLSTSSSVPENMPQTSNDPPPVYTDLSETFFCGKSWPIDCATAQPCQSGDMCPYGETCFTAPMCLEQQKDDFESAPTQQVETESDMSTFSASMSTEKPVASFLGDEKDFYPESTYFCGKSREDASAACSMPCPTRDSDDCPGDLQCFGDTRCEVRESFYCGSSWLDASDKCSTPCPNGDASVCGDGEACFAWTSCLNTQSYYCGVSFEDASENCAHPCESRSSLECPEGMGCFAYTTCQATNENVEHVVNPSSVPMTDYFCGLTVEDAATKCATGGGIACQSGNDDQCPGDMKCFETTECSDRSSYFCGTSWMDAAESCSKPCSSGSSDDCAEGESCFAHTGCQATNLFYCGMNFEDASETCGTPCEDRSSDSCPDDQLCFAYVTACAEKDSSDEDVSSMGAFADFSKFATPDEPWVASYWASVEASSSTKSSLKLLVATATIVFLVYAIL